MNRFRIAVFLAIFLLIPAVQAKSIVFTGFVPGVLQETLEKKEKALYDGVIAAIGEQGEKYLAPFSGRQLRGKKKHKFLVLGAEEGFMKRRAGKSAKNFMISFVSLDEVIPFAIKYESKAQEAHKAALYALFTFYVIDVTTQRIVYSRPFVAPMEKVVGGSLHNGYLRLIKESSGLLKKAITGVIGQVLDDPNLTKLVDQSSAMTLMTKRYVVMAEKGRKSEVRNLPALQLVAAYALAAKHANEIPMLPPASAHEPESDLSEKYWGALWNNFIDAAENELAELGFKVSVPETAKRFKPRGSKLAIPLFFVPRADYEIAASIATVSKVIKETRYVMDKGYAAQIKLSVRTGPKLKKSRLKRKKAEKFLAMARPMKPARAMVFAQRSKGMAQDTDIDFFNAVLKAIIDNKTPLGAGYPLQKLDLSM